MRSWSLFGLLCLLVGCSSAGTESGNPTRGCGSARCVCSPAVFLQVSDTSSGASVGATITVDGQSYSCSTTTSASSCGVSEARFYHRGMYELTVSAPGYETKTIAVDIPQDSECCNCSSGGTVDVTLDASP